MQNFRIQIVVRVCLIAAVVIGTITLYNYSESYVSAAVLIGLTAVQIGSLIRYVDKTNRDVSRFLRSVQYSDFSQSFSAHGRGKSFAELGTAFTEVMDDFKAAREETEIHHRFLQTVMQHVGIGLLTFQADGEIGLINNAAKRLFRVHHLKNVRALDSFSPALVDALLRMKSGTRSIVKVVIDEELFELVLFGTEFRLAERMYRLVSVQDIQSELEEREIEAWQKLTRVLTHEIMNSITPIASLAGTAAALLDGDVQIEDEPSVEIIDDVQSAVQTIERRSQGLLRFVQAYRSLTRIPRPDLKIFPVQDLVDGVVELFSSEISSMQIHLDIVIDPPGLALTADPELIEQVLINVVKNAIQSLSGRDDPRLSLQALIDPRGKTVIRVTDNGPGIEPEAMEKIFVPFFTTKPQGSGIGLSLSRQIMRQHGGTMSVRSNPSDFTTITLRFK